MATCRAGCSRLDICDGDDVDDVRVTAIEETLARTRARRCSSYARSLPGTVGLGDRA
jgi:hypothetical protein